VLSGGPTPAERLNPVAVEAMREVDPAGKPLAEVRPVLDEMERRVRRLLDELTVAVGASQGA
jgi:hypothetical protein